MSLLEKMKAKEAAKRAAEAPAAAATPPKADLDKKFEDAVAAERARLEAAERGPAVAPPDAPAPAKTHEPVPPEAHAEARAVATAAEKAASIPEGMRLLTVDEAVAKKVEIGGVVHKVKPVKIGDRWFCANPTSPPKASEPAAEKPAGYESPAPVATPASPPAVAHVDHARAAASGGGFTLYLDCAPDDVVAYRFEHYVESVAAALAEVAKAADVRCAPADSALGFGKWEGALAAAVREHPPGPGSYLVDGGNRLCRVAFEALVTRASRVVRGTR